MERKYNCRFSSYVIGVKTVDVMTQNGVVTTIPYTDYMLHVGPVRSRIEQYPTPCTP